MARATSTTTDSLFVGSQEREFFDSINKEIIQKIIGQKIIYYSVSIEHTNVDELYGEAISKTVFTPVEINALVEFNEPIESTTNWSIDSRYTISVYIHEKELKERNVEPREGDFLKHGRIFYEIKTSTRPQTTFGQIENMVMVKLECIVSRESNFSILDEEG